MYYVHIYDSSLTEICLKFGIIIFFSSVLETNKKSGKARISLKMEKMNDHTQVHTHVGVRYVEGTQLHVPQVKV